jgi:PPOX class probable F420-dependent enzyme
MIDFNTEFGAHVLHRLKNEEVVWITTVGPQGVPQPNPVWFLWTDDSFVIYTRPGSVKVRNLQANPNVALNFNSDEQGGQVVVFTGRARFEAGLPQAVVDAYLAKYREGIQRIEMTPESMLRSYSTILRVTPERMRGFR